MMPDPLPLAGEFVDVAGHQLTVRGRGRGYLWVEDTDGLDPGLERMVSAAGTHLVKVSTDHVDRRVRRRVLATWAGQEVVVLAEIAPRQVTVSWDGGDPAWARTQGLEGSQRDGWTGRAPRDQLTDVRVETEELS